MNKEEAATAIFKCLAEEEKFSWDAFSALSNAATAFIALLALFIAVAGLKTWKKQSLALERHNLAKRIIQNLHSRKIEVKKVRNPLSYLNTSKYLSPEIDPARILWKSNIDSFLERIIGLEGLQALANSDLIEAELILPKETVSSIKKINALEKELVENIYENIEATRPPPSEGFTDYEYDAEYIKELNERERYKKRRLIIYGVGGDRDEFSTKLYQAHEECIKRLKSSLIHNAK